MAGRLSVAAAGVAALSVCGCAGVVKPPSLAVDYPPAWRTSDPAQIAQAADTNWWTAFGDPTLNQIVEASLAVSPTVGQAALRRAAARADLGAGLAASLPQLAARGSGAVQRVLKGEQGVEPAAFESLGLSPEALSDLQAARRTRTYQANLDATWELGLFGRGANARAAVRGRAGIADEELNGARLSLAAETVRAYVQLRAAQTRSAILADEFEVQSKLHELAILRRQAEIAPDSEVRAALVARTRTQGDKANAIVAVRAAALTLAVLRGEAREDPALLADRASRQPVLSHVMAAGVPADLVRRRPDVRRAEQAMAVAAGAYGVARADLWPRLTLSGALAISGTPFGASAFQPEGPTVTSNLGPSIDVPLFAWGQRRAAAFARAAEFSATILAYQQTVVEAVADAQSALTRLETARAETERRRLIADAAEDDLRDAEILFAREVVAATDVLTRQSQRNLARLDLVAAREEEAIAAAAAFKALGGGVETQLQRTKPNDHASEIGAS